MHENPDALVFAASWHGEARAWLVRDGKAEEILPPVRFPRGARGKGGMTPEELLGIVVKLVERLAGKPKRVMRLTGEALRLLREAEEARKAPLGEAFALALLALFPEGAKPGKKVLEAALAKALEEAA